MHRIPSRECCAHLPNSSGPRSSKSWFAEYCQGIEFPASIGKKKLSYCCNSSNTAVTYIRSIDITAMFAEVHTHLHLHSCVYTQRYMLIHIQIPHTHSLRNRTFSVLQTPKSCETDISSPSGATWPLWHHCLHNYESSNHEMPNHKHFAWTERVCLHGCNSWITLPWLLSKLVFFKKTLTGVSFFLPTPK